MRPVAWSKLAAGALLALCYGAAPTASGRNTNDPPDLAQGTFDCQVAAAKGNINELNMSSANGDAHFLEVKVLDAALPTSTQLCYTTKENNGLTSNCATLGSDAVAVYRDNASTPLSPKPSAFQAGDYLVLTFPNGITEVNEAMLLTAAGEVIDHIQYCVGDCAAEPAYWTTTAPACSVQLNNVKSSVKDVARYPDGTGPWTSDTADNSPLDMDGTKGRSNGGLGPHHLELQHGSGSGITCATSVLTIKACADSACSSVYTDGLSGSVTGGAATTSFTIAANESTATIDFQPAAGAATLGASGTSNATTCNFGGSTSCTFTGTNAALLFSNTNTGPSYTIPTHTAGTVSATAYYLRAVQASSTNAAVCTPAIIGQKNVPVTISYACNNPATCQNASLLTLNTLVNGTGTAKTVPSAGDTVYFDFDSNGSAQVRFLYQDVGAITVRGSKTVTPTTAAAAVTLSGATNSFVVKPARFGLSDIKCGTVTNPSPTAATDPDSKFCKAGANFSVTATALTATGATAKNYGKESPTAETIKLSASLPAGLGLTSNPGLSGTLGAVNTNPAIGPINTGAATGAAFSWNEVGIITLTPSVDDPLTLAVETYLGAVGGEVSGTAVNVGRFVPDHYDTEVVTPPVFAYSGQPFTVRATAKLATPTAAVPLTATSVNYMAPGFPREVTLSARALDGTALAAGLGDLSNKTVPAAAFAASIGTGAPFYTFAARPTAPTVIRLRAEDTDNVTSALIEGNTAIRSGRLRLSNAFGGAGANLSIPVSAQYWTGNSWILNADDNGTTIPIGSVALSPAGPAGVAVSADVTLAGGQGFIVLTRPTSGTGSVALAVNLGGGTLDQSCLPNHPPSVGAAQPWLRSLNGNCPTGNNSDPSARGTFGIFAPESRRVIHIRESFN